MSGLRTMRARAVPAPCPRLRGGRKNELQLCPKRCHSICGSVQRLTRAQAAPQKLKKRSIVLVLIMNYVNM